MRLSEQQKRDADTAHRDSQSLACKLAQMERNALLLKCHILCIYKYLYTDGYIHCLAVKRKRRKQAAKNKTTPTNHKNYHFVQWEKRVATRMEEKAQHKHRHN